MVRKKISKEAIFSYRSSSAFAFCLIPVCFLWLTGGVALAAGSVTEPAFKSEPGERFAVKILRDIWVDDARQRQIPVKIYSRLRRKNRLRS